MPEGKSMSSLTTAGTEEGCSSVLSIIYEKSAEPEADHCHVWVSPQGTGEFHFSSETKHGRANEDHGSSYWQTFGDALVTGLYKSAGAGATFGVIRPSVEIVMTNILGKGPRKLIFEEDPLSQAMLMIAAIVAGFALGFTHTVVSQTFSNYLGQYIGYTSFEFNREGGNKRSQKVLNFLIDFLSHDVIAMICFGMTGAARSALFHGTGVSPVISVMLSATLGGFLTGVFQYFVKSSQTDSYALKRHGKASFGKCRTFFTIFEAEIGAMIRNEDFRVWFTQFVGKIVAGTLCRPLAIVFGDLVERTARNDGVPERATSTSQGLTSYLVFLAVWFTTLRVSDFAVTRYLFTTSGDIAST